jgi:hypothetical protein
MSIVSASPSPVRSKPCTRRVVIPVLSMSQERARTRAKGIESGRGYFNRHGDAPRANEIDIQVVTDRDAQPGQTLEFLATLLLALVQSDGQARAG